MGGLAYDDFLAFVDVDALCGVLYAHSLKVVVRVVAALLYFGLYFVDARAGAVGEDELDASCLGRDVSRGFEVCLAGRYLGVDGDEAECSGCLVEVVVEYFSR